MEAGHIQPILPPADPSRAWLVLQHDRDERAKEEMLDRIAELEGANIILERRCERYAVDQAALILDGQREARKPR